jgi:5-methylcytosine-specific restriction protein A
MTDAPPPLPQGSEAGWYEDPGVSGLLRWWFGSEWGEHGNKWGGLSGTPRPEDRFCSPRLIRSEAVGDEEWSLYLSDDHGRWRAAWTVPRPPSLPVCVCRMHGPPYHLAHCHSARDTSEPGWHRTKEAALACAQARLRQQQNWLAINRWWREEELPRQRRERKLGDKLRAKVLAEEPTCRLCGAPATEVDHALPIAVGGSSERANLVSLCRRCHRAKTKREAELGFYRWGH